MAIPALPDPSHLLLTASLSSMPMSLLPAAVDVCLGPGPLPGSLPWPPLSEVFSASAPLSFPLGGSQIGPSSGTPPGP